MCTSVSWHASSQSTPGCGQKWWWTRPSSTTPTLKSESSIDHGLLLPYSPQPLADCFASALLACFAQGQPPCQPPTPTLARPSPYIYPLQSERQTLHSHVACSMGHLNWPFKSFILKRAADKGVPLLPKILYTCTSSLLTTLRSSPP